MVIFRKARLFAQTLWKEWSDPTPPISVAEIPFKTGDIIAFNGKSLFSRLIKLATLSDISHVGMVVWRNGECFLAESTTLTTSADDVSGSKVKGVQFHYINRRVKEYDGKVYWYPLREELPVVAEHAIVDWCNGAHSKNVDYDMWQALLSAVDIDLKAFENKEDYKRLFCSEMAAKLLNVAWKAMGRHKPISNPSEETPADVVSYEVLRGRLARIV